MVAGRTVEIRLADTGALFGKAVAVTGEAAERLQFPKSGQVIDGSEVGRRVRNTEGLW